MTRRMAIFLAALFWCVAVDTACAEKEQIPLVIYDVRTGADTTLRDVLPHLRKVRLIFIGEVHDNRNHHRAQLEVVKALTESGVPVAIGLEMFSRDSQPELDRWTGGTTSESAFQKIYEDNWNLSWSLYSDIFRYARKKRIPMVGLNVPEKITEQVARHGFSSLTPSQKNAFPDVTCKVDPAYQEFAKRAHGIHGHVGMDFAHFCEAQLLWDTAMAMNAIEYLESHPQVTLVVLTGSGHAWRQGIPNQVARRSGLPYRVILPEALGLGEKARITKADADYLWLGL